LGSWQSPGWLSVDAIIDVFRTASSGCHVAILTGVDAAGAAAVPEISSGIDTSGISQTTTLTRIANQVRCPTARHWRACTRADGEGSVISTGRINVAGSSRARLSQLIEQCRVISVELGDALRG